MEIEFGMLQLTSYAQEPSFKLLIAQSTTPKIFPTEEAEASYQAVVIINNWLKTSSLVCE